MRRAFRRWFALIPVGALIALVAACGGGYEGGDDSGGAPALVAQDAQDNAAATGAARAYEGGSDSATSGQAQSQDFGRKIVRTATISLAIDDLDTALDAVRGIADSSGGFIATSDIIVDHSEDAQVARPQRASITLRVPAAQFDAAMDRLRDAAKGVDSENIGVSEVTSEYTDLESRLRNLKAAEAQYVALLERAATIDEIIRVQSNIDTVRGQIEQAQGRLNVLDSQVDLATITVNLRLVTAPVPVESDPHWAVQTLETSLEVSGAIMALFAMAIIAATVFSLWLVPMSLLALFFWKRFGGTISALARRLN